VLTTVAFDADDTLVATWDAVQVALAAVVADLAEPSLTLEVFRADSEDVWDDDPQRPVWELRRASLACTLARVGREEELERVAELFFDVRFANSRPFPGVPEMLAKLRTEYKIGYATNGNSQAARCGLAGLFDFELYAFRTGVPKKPDPAFYEALTTMAQTAPSSVVYVGDSYEHDVVGPAGFGMRTVWLNRSGRPVGGDVEPDAVIENLDDLPRILATWR
jgi:FMN hydrolase / 5-amino-6-(5-phospho-D-ribitylamino)uracil phosphatase